MRFLNAVRFSIKIPFFKSPRFDSPILLPCDLVAVFLVWKYQFILPGGGRVVRWCWVKLPVPGRPTILIAVGQGPIALAVGAGGGGLDIFTLIYPFSSFSLSLGDGPI